MTHSISKRRLSDLTELLANIEHERWAHWQRYMHGKAKRLPDGSLVISAELADRWERQFETPYSDLSEKEKQSDREQVSRYLPTVLSTLSVRIEEAEQEE